MFLAAAVKDASRPILELPLLSQADAAAILQGFNPKPSQEIPQTCLHNLFEQQADRQPDAPCIRTPEETLSYGQVEHRANALAHVLQSKGVESGSPVGIMLDRTPALYVAILAVLKAGGAYLPMDSAYPEDRLSFMASDAGIKVLITTESLAGLVQSVEAEVTLALSSAPALHSWQAEHWPLLPAVLAIRYLDCAFHVNVEQHEQPSVISTHHTAIWLWL